MSTHNDGLQTQEELDFFFGPIKDRKADERAKEAAEQARKEKIRKDAQLMHDTYEIIQTTEKTVNDLYPDLPIINHNKSINKTKIPCVNTHTIAKEASIFGKYILDETEFGFNKFKREIAPYIFHILAFTAITGFGLSTLLLELPISFFLEFGIVPAVIAEIIDKIVDPKIRKACLEKFQDFLNSNLAEKKHSGRRH